MEVGDVYRADQYLKDLEICGIEMRLVRSGDNADCVSTIALTPSRQLDGPVLQNAVRQAGTDCLQRKYHLDKQRGQPHMSLHRLLKTCDR